MYTSTRSKMNINASKAIIDGIAPDGGLFVKKLEKKFSNDDLVKLSKLSYKELAFEIMKLFFNDFKEENLSALIDKAYTNTFDTENLVEVKSFDKFAFLELYHGNTLAFKDVALSILPHLLDESKKINNQTNSTIILTATSGDTGSAALCGFSTADSTKMIVLYPTQGVSKIQEKQMLSFSSDKQKVIAINGNFDDAQRLVKKAFNDENNKEFNLSSANSINIGRLVPQIVYYFYSYFKEVKNCKDKINFVVPTGNFGNILAGYIAKELGLPVNKLICASNSNNVLYDFFKKGVYDRNREFFKTISPSMDILVSSNLERLLYHVSGSDLEVKGMMEDLNSKGKYETSLKFKDFHSEYVDIETTYKGIKEVYDKYDYLIDPHTAVGYIAYKKYVDETNDDTKTIIASTAHPFKFPEAICKALDLPFEGEFEAISMLSEKCNIKYPEVFKKLKSDYKKTVWEKEESYENLCNLIKELAND